MVQATVVAVLLLGAVGLGANAAVYHAESGPWTDVTTWTKAELPCSEDTIIVQATTQDTVVEIPSAQTRVVSGLALKPTTRIAFSPSAILAFKPPQAPSEDEGEAEEGAEGGAEKSSEVPCAPLQEAQVEPLTPTVALVRWTAADPTVASVTVRLQAASNAPVVMNHTEMGLRHMHVSGLQETVSYSVHVSIRRHKDPLRQVLVLTTSISMPHSVERTSSASTRAWAAPSAWRFSEASDKTPRQLGRNPCDEHVDLDKDLMVSGIERIASLTLGGPSARVAVAPEARVFFTFPVSPGEDTLEQCMGPSTATPRATPHASGSTPELQWTSTTHVLPGQNARVHLVLHISQEPSAVNRRQLLLALGAALNAQLNTHIFTTNGHVAITAILAASTGNSTALLDITVPEALRSETICAVPRLFAPFSASHPVASIYTSSPSVTLALVSLTRCLTCNCPTAGKPTCPPGSVLHISGECLSRPLCSGSNGDCSCPGGGMLGRVNGTWMCMVETVCSSRAGVYVPELGVCVSSDKEASISSSPAHSSIAVGASVGALALVIVIVFTLWYCRSKAHGKTALGPWPAASAHVGPDQQGPGNSLSQSHRLGSGVQRMNPIWQEPTFPPCAVADAREKGEAASGFDVDDNSTLYKIASQQRQHPPQQAFAMSEEERAMYDTPSRRGAAASQHRREAPPISTKSPTAHHTLQDAATTSRSSTGSGRRATQWSRSQRAYESPLYGTVLDASSSNPNSKKQNSDHYDGPYQPVDKQPVYASLTAAGSSLAHANGSVQDGQGQEEDLVYDVAENTDAPPALPPPRSSHSALSARNGVALQARGHEDQQA